METLNQPGVYHIADGEPEVRRSDLQVANLTFPGLLAFAATRAKDILAKNQPGKDDGVLVLYSKSAKTIEMRVREHGSSRSPGETAVLQPATIMKAAVRFSKDHEAVRALLNEEEYTHAEFAKRVRKLRHLFASRKEWHDLYRAMESTRFKIEEVHNTLKDAVTGERDRVTQAKIVEGQPPIEWDFFYSIYEGEDPVNMRVQENREIKGGRVVMYLAAFDFELLERQAVDAMMERTLTGLKAVLPEDQVPYVLLN